MEKKLQKRKAFNLILISFFISLLVCATQSIAQVNIGSSVYPTLKEAFDSINAGRHTGMISISITGNTSETSTVVLNASGTGNASYSRIVINPVGARTISGAAPNGSPLIKLNGADSVTIDGLNTGGNSLTISNTTVSGIAGTSTIMFIADACENTITHCTLLGSGTTLLATAGGIIFFSTGTTTGNDNNTVSYCNIGPAGINMASKGINGLGSSTSAAIANSGITIDHCDIYNFFSPNTNDGCAGIYATTGSTFWNLTHNRIYQTSPISIANTMYGIYFINTTVGDNIQITDNTIGYAEDAGAGTFTITGTGIFYGIRFGCMSASTKACNIAGNIISDFSFTSTLGTFWGIVLFNGGDTTNIINNQIRNINVIATSGGTTGIYTGLATVLNISSNTIDNITKNGTSPIACISHISACPVKITNNVISNIHANNTNITYDMYCIYTNSSSTNVVVSDNTITNVSTASIQGYIRLSGIEVNSSGNKIVSNNKISGLSAAGEENVIGININGSNLPPTEVSRNCINSLSGGRYIYGIKQQMNNSTLANIFNNKIYDLSSPNTVPCVYGIFLVSGTTNNVYNNIIGDLKAPNANKAVPVAGIYNYMSSYANIYHNTVFLNASSTGATFGSAAFYHENIHFTLRNNILVNISSHNGQGKTVAIQKIGQSLVQYDTSSDNNLLYADTPGPSNLIYYTPADSFQMLNAFQSYITPRESASITEYPHWISTSGADSMYLHIDPAFATAIESGGTNIPSITNDYDGDIRAGNPGYLGSGTTPDIGADEFELTVDCSGKPSPSTIVGVTQVCTGSGTLLSLSTNYPYQGISYQWAYSANQTGPYTDMGTFATQATGILTTATYYRCIITCSNSGYSDTTDVAIVNVSSVPEGGTAIPIATHICSGIGTIINLSGNSGNIQWLSSLNGTNWSIISGETSVTLSTGNITATTYYRALVSNGICTADSSTIAMVSVDPASIGGTAIPLAGHICLGSATTINLSGNIGNIQWLTSLNGTTWSIIAGETSGILSTGNITVTTYYRAIASNGDCAADSSSIAMVGVDPLSIGGTAVSTAGLICLGSATTVNLSGNNGNLQWQSSGDGIIWNDVPGQTSNGLPTGNLTSETYYRAIVQSGVCIPDTSNVAFVSVDSIIVLGNITGPATVCQGQQDVVYSVTAAPNSQYYTWSLPVGASGTSTTNIITVDYAVSAVMGNITVKGFNICGYGNVSSMSVTVNQKPPAAVITQNGSVLHSSASTGNQWYDQNGVINSATNQNYTVTVNGDYFVVVTTNGCSSDTSNVIHINDAGIGDINGQNRVEVYPNPAKDKLFVNFSDIKGIPENMKMFNNLGQIVFETNRPLLINLSGIDVSRLNAGYYILQIIFDKGVVNKAFIIK